MDSNIFSSVIVNRDVLFSRLISNYIKYTKGLELTGVFRDAVFSTLSIQRLKPDIVFMETELYGLEGSEMIQFLEYKPKVVMIGEQANRFQYNGLADLDIFLDKPVTYSAFREAVDRCFYEQVA